MGAERPRRLGCGSRPPRDVTTWRSSTPRGRTGAVQVELNGVSDRAATSFGGARDRAAFEGFEFRSGTRVDSARRIERPSGAVAAYQLIIARRE